MSERADPAGTASVIVPCRGPTELTRRCIAALARHTRPPWELIAVAGTDDRSADYLDGVRDAAPFRVEVLADRHGLDFHDACALGLRAARGDHIVLLRGDAVVADAWLDQLVALAEAGPRVGLAATMSNVAAPPQLVEDVAYADPEGLRRFAARRRADHLGRWAAVADPSGPCLLVRRRALEAVGGAGWRDRPGLLGDGLARRARDAGFAAVVALDLFVHRGPWPDRPAGTPGHDGCPTRIVALSRVEFDRRYGTPDTARALCGYTPPADTHAVLALLAHARPARVLEIGTALGHMTANLTEWSPDHARVTSLGTVRGHDTGGAAQQAREAPDPADLGRFAGHFGKRHKADVIDADSRRFDYARVAPLDFAFVDGGHDLAQALHDSRAAYAALAPGGWLVWHDVGHPQPWIEVRRAIEAAGFAEAVEHVEGTMVAFLRKDEPPPI